MSVNINLISLSKLKELLNITVSTSDAGLSAMIPIVSADIRRILNDNFDNTHSCVITAGSTTAVISEAYNPNGFVNMYSPLPVGLVLQSSGLANDTYISDYDVSNGQYTLSVAAIATLNICTHTINIAQWMAIAKMIYWKYSKMNYSSIDKDRAFSSESYGPISVSYADSEINSKYNYPSMLLKELGLTTFASVG